MKKEEFADRLSCACASVISAEQELTEIDSHFGDADHGLTMKKIAGAIDSAVKGSDGGIKEMLDDAAMAVMVLNGGSAVPLWNAWLDRQREGHEPDMPTPPVGFQYAPGEVDEFDYGEPDLEDEQLTEDQKRDMLGLVHDYAMNTSELARTMLDCQHFDDPQVRELVRQTFKDLECAGSHVSDALKLMGWTADDATVG